MVFVIVSVMNTLNKCNLIYIIRRDDNIIYINQCM
jgi:hypothetical protein